MAQTQQRSKQAASASAPKEVEKTEQDYLNEFLKTAGYKPDEQQEEEDLSQYEEQPTTVFPPYWKPLLGAGFIARVITCDARDPEFLRYVLEAAAPVMCRVGSAQQDNLVQVEIGEQFTTSVYRGLPLHEYMGLLDPIVVVCVGQRQVKGRPNDMWVFKIRTSTRDSATLAERRAIQRNGNPELSERIRQAFTLAHTAKDTKTAVKAALNG